MNIGKLFTLLQENKQYVKILFFTTFSLLMISGFMKHYFVNLCILGYLSYRSLEFMKNNHVDSSQPVDMSLITMGATLLQNWTTFSVLIIFEYLLSFVLQIFIISFFYDVIKIFGLAMFFQSDNNVTFIHHIMIEPLYVYHEIYIKQMTTLLEDLANEFRKRASHQENAYNLVTYIRPYLNPMMSYLFKKKKKTE
jgi:hypothetical protein